MKISIRTVILFSLVTLIVSTSLIITITYYLSTSKSTREIGEHLMQKISNNIAKNTISHLRPAYLLAKLIKELNINDAIDVDTLGKKVDEMDINHLIHEINNFSLYRHFTCMLKTYDQVSMIYFADTTKDNFFLVRRYHDQIKPYFRTKKHGACYISTDEKGNKELDCKPNDKRHKSYYIDYRKRSWYENAKEKNSVVFNDVILFTGDKKVGIIASAPILDKDKKFLGAVGVDIVVDDISSFIKKQKVGKHRYYKGEQERGNKLSKGETGVAFIIDNRNGDLVAYPDLEQLIYRDKEQKKDIISKIVDIGDEWVVKSFLSLCDFKKVKDARRIIKSKIRNKEKILNFEGRTIFTYSYNNKNYWALYEKFPEDYGWDWYIGIVVPEDDFMAGVKKNTYFALIIALSCLLISVIIGFMTSRKIVRPIEFLTKKTEKIKDFELEPKIQIRSNFSEIITMGEAFDNMRIGLKSFEKYVTSDLVRYLVKNGIEAKLGGVRKRLTIFFSDIADFTKISEEMPPEDLVKFLGEYLDEMSGIILRSKGTVDKYIGDAVMAFWGAPIDVENHAVIACLSALESQRRLSELQEKWKTEGKPIFNARIGINTGEVIVGNIGSKERLDYTVIGDNVNLTSRLEGLNKSYKTKIIISQSTYEDAKDEIEARILDYVIVKGKTENIYVYELLGRNNNIDSTTEKLVKKFSEGFERYMNEDWNSAIRLFKEALKIKEDDYPTRLFIERCKEKLS